MRLVKKVDFLTLGRFDYFYESVNICTVKYFTSKKNKTARNRNYLSQTHIFEKKDAFNGNSRLLYIEKKPKGDEIVNLLRPLYHRQILLTRGPFSAMGKFQKHNTGEQKKSFVPKHTFLS